MVKRIALLALAGLPYAFLSAQAPTAKVSYTRDVAPILRAHCGSCHGAEAPSGKLNLVTVAGIRRGGRSGAMWSGTDPAKSILIERVLGHGGLPRMPMDMAPLAREQVSILQRWVAEGATFDNVKLAPHWAYVAPKRPPLPAAAKSTWVRNPIDAFVLARMKKEGLAPSTAADRETLIRRVSLDLVGLPPTLAEIDAFLADRRPDAYERVVNRLLASPQYGEHQARPWLDLARYADSDGYEKDLNRTAWPYRDWLINAFNRNMPYDQFTVEQLAGDLLPGASISQRVATGFHRNTMFNREGGVNQEEAHFAVILDRVDTTATVWLGSTLACARCHDHKYDPFKQRDYYRMAAFFNNTVVIPRGPKEVSEEKWFEPELPVPTADQAAREQRLVRQVAALEADVKRPDPALDAGFDGWRSSLRDDAAWTVLHPTAASVDGGSTASVDADGYVRIGGVNPPRQTARVETVSAPAGATGIRLEVAPDSTGKGPGRAENGNFVLTGVRVAAAGSPVELASAAADFVQVEYDPKRVLTGDVASGWAINGGNGRAHQLVISFARPLPVAQSLSIVLEQRSKWDFHNIGRFRISATTAPSPTSLVVGPKIIALARSDAAADRTLLLDYYRTSSPSRQVARTALMAAQRQLADLRASMPTALVMEERPGTDPLTEYVRNRGEFMGKRERVTAGTPEVLPEIAGRRRADRLTLAKWLVRRDNPLTARVEVNRMWAEIFGRGIVETSEDFGTRGARPTHPELLDWLACEFMDRGWDMKAIQRLIVTSATYRQASNATAKRMAVDPQNFLLARGPRFRLDAETIRDSSLAVGGLLDLKVGGPSVYPPQPDGIWDSPYSGDRWMTSEGRERYRRGIYTFWKRTAPYPSFATFDATSRESCTVRRIRTNTPLQALAMLNDQAMLEASAALAERMIAAGPAVARRLEVGFRLCTGRRPRPPEMTRLLALQDQLSRRYAAKPDRAKKLGGTPDRAAWTMVGNVLLNLDETLTKG